MKLHLDPKGVIDAAAFERPGQVDRMHVRCLGPALYGDQPVARVDAHRHALLEADHDGALVGGRLLGEQPHALRRLGPGVLHLAALDGPAPEVVVDRVHLLLGGHDRDLVRRPSKALQQHSWRN